MSSGAGARHSDKSISRFSMKIFFLALTLFYSINSFSQENGTSDALTFGVLPYLVPSHMLSTFGSASANLSQQTGLNINFRTASDYLKFIENLNSLKYDMAIIQPFDVQLAVKKLGYIPVAQVSEALDIVFVTKADSKIKSLGDLKGETIAMAPKTAATSIVALAELENRGFELNKTVKIKFVKSHDACLHEVVLNQAAACATGTPPVLAFEKRTNAKFNIFYRSESIPHMAFVVHQRVPEAQREQITKAVLSWKNTPKGLEILQKMNFPGWISANYQDYEMLEKFSSSDITTTQRSDGTLLFAAFPYLPPKRLVEILAPMPLRFTEILGRKVHFRTSLSFTKFRSNIADNQYDIIMVQPFDFDFAIKNGYRPIAQLKEKISAAFYTKANSSINTLEDLKGKTIATPPYEAAVTRLASLYLIQNNFTIGQDITINYRKSHESCIEQLMQDNVAACVTSKLYVDRILEENKSIQLKTIAESKKIPGVVIMAHNRMSEEDFEKIKSDIQNWGNTKAGKQLLKDTRFPGFGPVVAADFNNLTSP